MGVAVLLLSFFIVFLVGMNEGKNETVNSLFRGLEDEVPKGVAVKYSAVIVTKRSGDGEFIDLFCSDHSIRVISEEEYERLKKKREESPP